MSGRHDSNHEHHHSENCSCGHEHTAHVHGHNHEHDEGTCSCSHDHKHGHHDEHNHAPVHAAGDNYGEIHVERHMHDEARVISGSLLLFTEYEKLRAAMAAQLEKLAEHVTEHGGIVGHIKASCEVLSVEMFSVTDTDVSAKKAPGQRIKINVAAIVFLIEPETAERLVSEALNAVKAAALTET